jgi:precorrin-6Y C5,15-methyltransferase (decarboxylating)
LEVVEGEAPAALTKLAPPDAIFVGGGAGDPGVLDAAISALRPGGRLVVNAVTLATESLLISRHATFGGELMRIGISRAEPLGRSADAPGPMVWRPAMPVAQWTWVKP